MKISMGNSECMSKLKELLLNVMMFKFRKTRKPKKEFYREKTNWRDDPNVMFHRRDF